MGGNDDDDDGDDNTPATRARTTIGKVGSCQYTLSLPPSPSCCCHVVLLFVSLMKELEGSLGLEKEWLQPSSPKLFSISDSIVLLFCVVVVAAGMLSLSS